MVSSVLFKYTFILSTFGLVAVMLYDSLFVKKTKMLLYILIIFSIILLTPFFLRNYIYYGDPISPLLSVYLSDTEPALSFFKEQLKAGYSFNVSNIIKIPLLKGL